MFIFKVRQLVRLTLLLSSCGASISAAQTVIPIQNGPRTPMSFCDPNGQFCFVESTPSSGTFATPGLAYPSNATAVGPSAYVGANQGTAVGFQSVVTGVNSVAIGAGSHDNGLSNVVSVGNFGAERQIVYVAPGTVAPDSTNAVNGGQLFAVQESANQALTAANSANSAAAEALSAANRANTTAAQVLTSANAVSRSLDQVVQQVGNLARDANAGTATAIASANIPQAYGPRSTAIGAAFGTWKGETSFAVGASHNFNRFGLRGSFNVNSDGSTGGGAGFGLQF